MAIQMQQFEGSSALDGIEVALWETLKKKLNPVVYAWYDSHKDQKVTKILGIYTVTIGSFGIAVAIISHVFGPRT